MEHEKLSIDLKRGKSYLATENFPNSALQDAELKYQGEELCSDGLYRHIFHVPAEFHSVVGNSRVKWSQAKVRLYLSQNGLEPVASRASKLKNKIF